MALYRLSFNHAGYVLPLLTLFLGAQVHASDTIISEGIEHQPNSASLSESPQGDRQIELSSFEALNVIQAATTSAADLVLHSEDVVHADTEEPTLLAQSDETLAEAEDDSGWYVSIAPALVFGYSLDGTVVGVDTEIDAETGFGIGGAAGYRFDENFQAELEVAYNRSEADSIEAAGVTSELTGNFEIFTFMANGYYNIPTQTPFTPYVGGGVGLGIVEANDVATTAIRPTLIDGSATSFVFQVKAGVNYEVTDDLSAFLGYRLYGLPGVNFEDSLGNEYDVDTTFIHSIQLGARYEF